MIYHVLTIIEYFNMFDIAFDEVFKDSDIKPVVVKVKVN